MKKLSLLLAIMMLLSSLAVPAMAEDVIKESASGFYYIEANGDQKKLSADSKEIFIQADGLYFKDLNKNGALDVYEDYRKPVADRVNDLMSQMTLKEKTGTLAFAGIGGKNGITVTDFSKVGEVSQGTSGTAYIFPDSEQMNSSEAVAINVDGVNYAPVAYQVKEMGVTTMIAAMTGAPKDQLDVLNQIQTIAEEARLGIPVVFSGDRSYNTWGGMIDMAHYAFGVAHDEELLYNLVSEYAKESVAIGYHQVFHGYANEIGAFYGDEVNYLSKMAAIETRAYDDWGFNSHSKHFIARGGRNAYKAAKSPADLIDSWMVGWKAVVDAGTQYIMTNNNEGITPGLQGYMDKATYDILRNDLGYDGVVCLDWPLDASSLMSKTGITRDGVDVSTLTLGERYALILEAGVDMFSCYCAVPGADLELANGLGLQRYFPDVLAAEVEAGKLDMAQIDESVLRVLRNKFDLGIFEDPFSDWEAALALIGTDAYVASGLAVPMNNEEIDLYRRPEVAAMEQELMVKSTIMLKNDGILPLQAGVKIYADSNNSGIKEADAAALAAYGTLVATYEEADVVVYHTTAFNENYEYMVEDATAAGKPIVLIWEGVEGRNGAQGEPYGAQVEACNAILMQTYKNTPDHGSSVGSFYRYVTPSITADMLFGAKDPAGSTVFEVPYVADDLKTSWGELQHDIGVDKDVRLYMAMLAKDNPNILMPNNLGDVLFTTNYGMSYANPAAIELSLLTVDKALVTTINESNGRASTSVQNAVQKAGVPFEISFVAKNNGGDGHVTVQVMDGENVAAEKFVAVDGNAWRVINVELTLEAGEHVISIGDMAETIVVE